MVYLQVKFITVIIKGIKRKRCGRCQGCTADDCGECRQCLDMPKFGGPGKRKKCCIKRQCITPITPTQVHVSTNIMHAYE